MDFSLFDEENINNKKWRFFSATKELETFFYNKWILKNKQMNKIKNINNQNKIK
jgi:hypothetical protein